MKTEPTIVRTAAAMIVGGEILSGKIRDENSHELALTLRRLGISLERIATLPDEVETIADCARRFRSEFDLVVTSGGVGPTHDDVTMAGLARAFDEPLVLHESLVEILRGFYSDALTDAHLSMARIPASSTLIESQDVRWPLIETRGIYSFPGVPELFRSKLGVLRELFRGPGPFFTRELFFDLEEVRLKSALDRVVRDHPRVEIGSYPKLFDPGYKTRITFDGREEGFVDAACAALEEALGPHLVAHETRSPKAP